VKHQRLRLGFDAFMHLTTFKENEIIPGKHSDTRIKPDTPGIISFSLKVVKCMPFG
jgi:hypothetical protein